MTEVQHIKKEKAAGPHRLTVRDLHIHYGAVCALEDISFDTTCGRTVALVGGNGAGKSTLLKTLVGLIPVTRGSVRWRGRPIKKSPHEMAYLPQRADIDWSFPLTVRALVEMGRFALLGPWRRFGAADRAAVDRAMQTMGLAGLAGRQIGALSGGQQQRAFVARALAQEAHVLLLDEPFAGLDEPARAALSNLFRDLADSGRLVMASHHDLATVENLFDEVLLLNRRMIGFGPPAGTLTAEHLRQTFSDPSGSAGEAPHG